MVSGQERSSGFHGSHSDLSALTLFVRAIPCSAMMPKDWYGSAPERAAPWEMKRGKSVPRVTNRQTNYLLCYVHWQTTGPR